VLESESEKAVTIIVLFPHKLFHTFMFLSIMLGFSELRSNAPISGFGWIGLPARLSWMRCPGASTPLETSGCQPLLGMWSHLWLVNKIHSRRPDTRLESRVARGWHRSKRKPSLDRNEPRNKPSRGTRTTSKYEHKKNYTKKEQTQARYGRRMW
jgi:hypothetical protein